MNKKQKNSRSRNAITRSLMMQYIISLLSFFVVLVLLAVGVVRVCRQFIWQGNELLYILLKAIEYNIEICGSVVLLIGWTGITWYYLGKPVRYLNEVISASEEIVGNIEKPIELSGALKSVEYELNLVREQALRNALIAKEAEQRKNDLIVYLAHDLKTPLTSVIGYLTLLRDEPQISEEMRARYTGIALDKAERLEELINEFFDITRFNLTTLTLDTERIILSRMLEQIAFEFQPVLTEKKLHISTDIEPEVEILCDPEKLERVFDNLIRNAVNYSYEGTEISLSMKKLGENVEICIRNCGKTIPPEKLERIFEQFFRLDSSRASSTGGAGLGLAIAKEIVELHGGSIKAESENESIDFLVTLPVDCQKIVRIS